MTEEEFAKQQHGQCADPETGAVVGTVGDAAYQGAIIAGFVAMLFR